MIRTVIVDDSELFRAGLRMIVESGSGTTVVGEATNGIDAVSLVESLPGEIDVVLMDIDMPGLNGVDATARILDLDAPPKILIVTTYAVDNLAYNAIMAGASGFLLKDTPPDALLSAIEATHRGTAVVSPQMTRQLLCSVSPQRAAIPADDSVRRRWESLTDRERDVLEAIAQGLNNSEIADKLFIAEVTVKTHVGRVLRKLDVRDRIQCVVFAHTAGLVSD